MIEQLPDQQLTTLLRDIQKKYWRFDAEEKASLVQRDPLQLPWPDMLRLNHLCCLEILQTKLGKYYLDDPDAYGRDLGSGSVVDLHRGLDLAFWPDVLRKLLSAASPYRPRISLIWQDKPVVRRKADFQGLFMNASITHIGSFEIIRVDANRKPVKLGFVGLDELRSVKFAGGALFRAAKLFYDDGRADEIVWMPLIYGVSWACPDDQDHNGTFTRWVGHMPVEIGGACRDMGIGIGHQDFDITNSAKKGAILVGLGSLDEIEIALDIDDPKFEMKCQVRGLNPDDGRRVTHGGNWLSHLARRLFRRH
jgi:hypothetical protein